MLNYSITGKIILPLPHAAMPSALSYLAAYPQRFFRVQAEIKLLLNDNIYIWKTQIKWISPHSPSTVICNWHDEYCD